MSRVREKKPFGLSRFTSGYTIQNDKKNCSVFAWTGFSAGYKAEIVCQSLRKVISFSY